jgi:DNA-binding NtrC family response regulator
VTTVPKPSFTVLVLEDDPIVRSSIARILRREGYDVLEAETPAEARLIVDKLRRPIALLVCDLELKGLQGREAAIMLQALRPEMRVLFMSGGSGAHFHEQIQKEHRYFLKKPFDRRRLLELVGYVLEGWRRQA